MQKYSLACLGSGNIASYVKRMIKLTPKCHLEISWPGEDELSSVDWLVVCCMVKNPVFRLIVWWTLGLGSPFENSQSISCSLLWHYHVPIFIFILSFSLLFIYEQCIYTAHLNDFVKYNLSKIPFSQYVFC